MLGGLPTTRRRHSGLHRCLVPISLEFIFNEPISLTSFFVNHKPSRKMRNGSSVIQEAAARWKGLKEWWGDDWTVHGPWNIRWHPVGLGDVRKWKIMEIFATFYHRVEWKCESVGNAEMMEENFLLLGVNYWNKLLSSMKNILCRLWVILKHNGFIKAELLLNVPQIRND